MAMVMGTIRHSKLMELKNSGVVDEYGYVKICENMFKKNNKLKKDTFNILSPLEKLQVILNRRFFTSWPVFMVKSSWRFRKDNLHLIFLQAEEIDELDLAQQAYKYSRAANTVLEGFKIFDEVSVDSYTAKAVDWLLHNKHKLKSLLQQKG